MRNQQHRFNIRYPNLKGTIFIITYGRSGSTLLQSVLQSIPGAHITGENDNLIMVLWNAYKKVNGAKNSWGARGSEKLAHPWHGAHNFRPNYFANRLIDAFVDEVIRPNTDCTWLGFKEIRYIQFGDDLPLVLNFMARTFKNSYFIFNTRNAESVAKSSWWKNKNSDEVKEMVHAQDSRFEKYAKNHPENSFKISYDSFISNPLAIKPFFEMLNEDFDLINIEKILSKKLKH